MPQVETKSEGAAFRTRLNVTSSAFQNGDTVPTRYTADGQDLSPPLAWGDAPARTQSFAVICEDPDAPSGRFVHWLLWNIEANQRDLDEGLAKTAEAWGLRQGQNGFGKTGYGGPKPPPGRPHRYIFSVYALDHRPDIAGGASRAEIDHAIAGHVLAEGVLVGTYGR
jgi:Raf kinase inhibitor-like YbhB/YbcL family protein